MQARVVSNEKYNPPPPYTHTNVDLKDEYEDVLVNICMLMEIPYVLRQNVDTINLILFIGRRGCLFHFFIMKLIYSYFNFLVGEDPQIPSPCMKFYQQILTYFHFFLF